MIQFALLALAAPIAMLSFFRWHLGIYGLLLFLPISGAISLWLKPTLLAILGPLLKDFLFVLPIYGGFLLFGLNQLRGTRVPWPMVMALTLFVIVALVQTMNPGLINTLVAIVGLKVWLMYIPLLLIGAAWVISFDRLVHALRLLAVLTLIPSGIGLLQWVLSATIGYQAAISMFYGQAAWGATQNFGGFNYGGQFYRIPSTFSFVAQYSSYLLAMFVPVMTVALTDPSSRWRRRGWIIFTVLVVASFLCGARSAYAMTPLIIGLVFILDGRVTGAVAMGVMLPGVLLTTLFVAGLDPLQVLGATGDLVVGYSQTLVIRGVLDSLAEYPFGLGTGMSTGAARYVVGESEATPLIESFFAKAVVELGAPGLFILVLVFMATLIAIWDAKRQLIHPLFKTFGATVLAYALMIVVNSSKGAILDIDPANIYYWLFVGMLLKLPFLESEILQRINRQRAPHPLSRPGRDS